MAIVPTVLETPFWFAQAEFPPPTAWRYPSVGGAVDTTPVRERSPRDPVPRFEPPAPGGADDRCRMGGEKMTGETPRYIVRPASQPNRFLVWDTTAEAVV